MEGIPGKQKISVLNAGSDPGRYRLNPDPISTLAGTSTVKVALLSDSHGFIDPRITELIAQCDVLVHAGDICDADVFDNLQPRLGVVYAVRGNNDQPHLWQQDQLAVLEELPDQLEIMLPGGTLVVEHGHRHGHRQPSHDSLRQSHPHARVIAYGHTHKRLHDDSDNPWIINPGASGITRAHGGSGCIILTASLSFWQVKLFSFPAIN